MQERSYSIAIPLVLHLSCSNPLIYLFIMALGYLIMPQIIGNINSCYILWQHQAITQVNFHLLILSSKSIHMNPFSAEKQRKFNIKCIWK